MSCRRIVAGSLLFCGLLLSGCSFKLFGGIGEPAHVARTRVAKRAVEMNAANAHAWFLVGRGMMADGENGKAISAYRKAISVQPDFVEPRLGIARIHIKQKRWKLADRELRRILEIESDSLGAFEGLARCAMERKAIEEAEEWANRAVSLDPESAAGHRVLGEAHYIRGEYEEAIEHWTFVPASDLKDTVADLRHYVAKYRD